MPSATGKATVGVSGIDVRGFKADKQSVGGNVTLKHTRDDLTFSLAVTDGTVKDVKSLTGAVATAEYKLNDETKLKGTYDLGARKLKYGLNWNGSIEGRSASLKADYCGKLKGEVSLEVNSSGKATIEYEDFSVTSAKYSLSHGDFTYEPSYSFVKQAPAVSISTSRGKDKYKLSYDVKSEEAALEWNRKPYKVTLSNTVNASGVGKPSLSAVWEQTFDI